MITNTSLPQGFTFIDPSTLVSGNASKLISDLLTKAENRNPDAFGIYVYNDFYNYGLLDLVDKTLSTLHTKIVKKQWDDAWTLVETLTVFLDLESSWPMCDDGDRVSHTNNVYGASVVTVIRALQAADRLDTEHIPNLDTILRLIVEWGSAMNGMGVAKMNYHRVCMGIGKRLFAGQEAHLKALHKSRLTAWLNTLSPERKKSAKKDIRERELETEEEEEHASWFRRAKDGDEDGEDDDYVLSRVWRTYKAHLADVPTKPLRGPSNWDISKWKKSDIQQFSMDGSDGSGDEMMF